MPGNTIPPPTGNPEIELNLALIYEAVELPDRYRSREIIRSHVLPSIITAFSDGEVTLQHQYEPDPVLSRHFGRMFFAEGTFGRRLQELFEGSDISMRDHVDGLVRRAAGVLARDVVAGRVALPRQTVRINPGHDALTNTNQAMLEFDGYRVELAKPPQLVIDYGPGLRGHFHIDQQWKDIAARRQPFSYFAVGKGPFINQFLREYWLALLNGNQDLWGEVTARQLYLGREDGMAAASSELVHFQRQHTGSAEVADVVLASGIYSVEPGEVYAAITNAYHLLQPDGVLLIRSPKASAIDGESLLPAGAMVEMALEAGFSSSKAEFFDVLTGTDLSLEPIDSLAAVLRK